MKKSMRIVMLMMFLFGLFVTSEAGLFKKKSKEAKKQELNIWAFTDELQVVIDDFKAAHPDVDVKFTIIPAEEYPTKLKPVLRSGVGAPDIFLGEMSAVKKWLDTGYWIDLKKEFPNEIAKYESQAPGYVVDMGRDSNGTLRAVSWQATPGGFYYRRSLAKKYLGTDDPTKMSEMMSTPEKFIELGRKLRDESNGVVKILPGFGDYEWIARAGRKSGWVNERNELVIDKAMLDYFEISKTLRDENLDAKIGQWSPAWFAGMNQNEIFGYVLPTWGLHYVIKKNAKDTAGDWAIAKGPSSYYWGGTWMGIYSKSKNKELAFEFVNMLNIDDKYMEEYARKTGDFMSNIKIDEKLSKEPGMEFLGGQNHYAFFMQEAKNITPGLETKYDLELNGMFLNAINLYVDGVATKEEAIKTFKENVANSFPEIIIK
jgi:ABC-type glycerol-3-phosphate transport system substrate-binding protein